MKVLAVSSLGTVSVVENVHTAPRVVADRGGNWPAVSCAGFVAVPVLATEPGGRSAIRAFGGGALPPAEVPGSGLEPGSQIAPGLSHYVYWDPKGECLLFVQPSNGILELRSWAPGMTESRGILAGAPLFLAFDARGSRLAVHHGSTQTGWLRVYDVDRTGPGGERLNVRGVGGFGAPAFCHEGRLVVWAEPADGAVRLQAAALDTGRAFDGPMVEGPVRFVPGPVLDEVLIAVADADHPPLYAALLAWNPQRRSMRTVHRGRFLAAWQSPGRRHGVIALALPGFTPESRVQIAVVDEEGRHIALMEPFVPSAATQLAMAFFDQFGRSHSPWSPRGEWFALSGRLAAEGPFALLGPPEMDRILGFSIPDAGEHGVRWQALAAGAAGWVIDPVIEPA